jgi:hypothetical protein
MVAAVTVVDARRWAKEDPMTSRARRALATAISVAGPLLPILAILLHGGAKRW